jgi:peroxiredoxin
LKEVFVMEEKGIALGVGQTAPEFVLRDQDGKDVSWSESKGRLVLLSFHPLAWTGLCAKQMQALEQNKDMFESLGTVPLGLSVDTVPSKKAWADHLGIKSLRLLSDFWPHGEAAKAYGIFREKGGTSERANIIVDKNGKIAFVKVYEISQLPDIAEVMEVLKKL